MGLELPAPQAVRRRSSVCARAAPYELNMPRLSSKLWPPLKPGASDMVAIAGGLLAFAPVAGGALPVLPPSLAMTLPAPAGCACLGDGSVSFATLRLASVACVSSGPKGSTMPRASCRIGEGTPQVSDSLPHIRPCHAGIARTLQWETLSLSPGLIRDTHKLAVEETQLVASLLDWMVLCNRTLPCTKYPKDVT